MIVKPTLTERAYAVSQLRQLARTLLQMARYSSSEGQIAIAGALKVAVRLTRKRAARVWAEK